MSTQPKYWGSPAPAKCDLCHGPIVDWFVDGKTKIGPWGIMCTKCYFSCGVGVGPGTGQQYSLVDDKWLKIL